MDAELTRRYASIRAAMAEHELDALVVSGSEYSGFEGSVTYLSGFQIVHRYAYVVVPADGEPQIVFPTEARYVGEHGTAQLEQVFHDRPGEHIAATTRDRGWARIGVYGLDYIMSVRDYRALEGRAELVPFDVEFDLARAVKSDAELESVRDYRALEGSAELVPFDVEFDLARAVKSEAELESVRHSVRINEDGFEAFLGAYEPGRTAAEVMAPAEQLFVERGCGRLTMNMVLIGPEFGIAKAETVLGDFVLPSLEVAGPGMHWVEVSRAIGSANGETLHMLEAYEEYHAAAPAELRPGATAHDVHRAVSKGFTERGYHLGHVTGHSIGMTMIEHPKLGEGVDTELAAGMVFSLHPHAIGADGKDCLYMQDTWLVTETGGEKLSRLPLRIY